MTCSQPALTDAISVFLHSQLTSCNVCMDVMTTYKVVCPEHRIMHAKALSLPGELQNLPSACCDD